MGLDSERVALDGVSENVEYEAFCPSPPPPPPPPPPSPPLAAQGKAGIRKGTKEIGWTRPE